MVFLKAAVQRHSEKLVSWKLFQILEKEFSFSKVAGQPVTWLNSHSTTSVFPEIFLWNTFKNSFGWLLNVYIVFRGDCCELYPQSLPKLLQCVKWNSKEYVSQVRRLHCRNKCFFITHDLLIICPTIHNDACQDI